VRFLFVSVERRVGGQAAASCLDGLDALRRSEIIWAGSHSGRAKLAAAIAA
jgi:hypothetical protein